MKVRRICLCIIFALMCLMVLVGCQGQSAPAPTPEQSMEAAPRPITAPLPVSDPESGEQVYTVSTVDEFLLALGSERKIVLEEGFYDLSLAENYGIGAGDCWYWNECYDGYELVINAAESLSIVGTGDSGILTRPRYANVLRLENCRDISILGLTLGHTVEPGTCTGNVIYLENCEDIRIDSSALYGCGIVGLNAFNSRDIQLSACSIYGCSYSAVQLSACNDVQLRDCGIYSNGSNFFGPLFQVDTSRGFALVNCEIYENSATALVNGNYSQQIYLLGCAVRDNSFTETVFNCQGYSPIWDKCSFDSNGNVELYSDMPPMDAEGNLMELADMLNMQQESAEYYGPASAEPVELNESFNAEGIRQVRVSTVDEFLAAIGNDTAIKLEPGLYDLSQAADYGAYGTEYYHWIDTYDGPALVISGVQNLSIDSEDGVSITALPRYANVLSFVNCENISLTGFTAGHSEGAGTCTGDVLSFENCWGVDILDCRLFGCGTWGINAYYCSDMNVTATEIYDCTIGAIGLYTVMGAEFERMNIHDCATPEFSLADCMDVNYEGQELKSGDYILIGGVPTEYRY